MAGGTWLKDDLTPPRSPSPLESSLTGARRAICRHVHVYVYVDACPHPSSRVFPALVVRAASTAAVAVAAAAAASAAISSSLTADVAP